MAAKTYGTVGAALADPGSSLARFVRRGEDRRAERERVIAAWMAQGLTREEAWAKALARVN